MQNKFGHVETISYLCSIKKNKEKQQFKTAVDRINTDTETVKLQNINTGKIDDLQNCQYYNEKQVIYKINLRPWVMPGEKFFVSHESVTPKAGEGSNFTAEGWTILDIAPGWEIVKGKKAGKQPAAGTPKEEEKEEEKKQPESAPAESVQPQPQPQQETKPTTATAQEQQPAQPKMQKTESSNDFAALINFAASLESRIKASILAELPKMQPAAQPETKRETITIQNGQQVGKVEGHTCKNFEKIVKTVSQNFPVYMYGPAGCGKSHTAKQVAESLGLDFYETSTVLFAHEMKGYGDANGNFVETPFYKAFVNGGLFFLDEVDASAPDALVVLNTAIANGRFDFPVVGNKKAHENFRVMAAGNTLMTGADLDYTARSVQDKSFINRFFFVGFDYDVEIEKAITGGDNELIEFAHDFRKTATRAGLSICLSYRQLTMLSNKVLVDSWGRDQLIKNSFLSCVSVDDINVIAGNMSTGSNAWTVALKSLCR